ncbi:hypothetical protein [Streptomyces corynorhini]|uniref:Sensor domain-containing protein n=1 Tax=Streptomyces corynorhini TaxID=2282652 RepID=A0A370B3K9_9ACTN|nr:hypothetical protein [Streptomyces corynorhini]RDG34969.1 hypothetical protein DVH02_27750 [Streptomyces corynorhini]
MVRAGRRVAVWTAAGAVVLGGAGCGAGDREHGDGKAGRPSASATATGAAPLARARLIAASFTEGERIGKYTASEYSLGVPLGENYTATPAVCQPFVSLAAGATAFTPAAEVHRRVDVPGETLGPTVAVQLRSYPGQGAKGVMKALGRAERACADGFTEERAVARATYPKAEPVTAPRVGDEAAAYRFTILDVKGKLKLYEYLTVVRSGSTTLSFRAEITGTRDIGGVPEEIVRAQWEKFRPER